MTSVSNLAREEAKGLVYWLGNLESWNGTMLYFLRRSCANEAYEGDLIICVQIAAHAARMVLSYDDWDDREDDERLHWMNEGFV